MSCISEFTVPGFSALELGLIDVLQTHSSYFLQYNLHYPLTCSGYSDKLFYWQAYFPGLVSLVAFTCLPVASITVFLHKLFFYPGPSHFIQCLGKWFLLTCWLVSCLWIGYKHDCFSSFYFLFLHTFLNV